jgi:hypothetical protein
MVVLKSSPAVAKPCLIVRQSPRSLSIRVGGVLDEDALSDGALAALLGALSVVGALVSGDRLDSRG